MDLLLVFQMDDYLYSRIGPRMCELETYSKYRFGIGACVRKNFEFNGARILRQEDCTVVVIDTEEKF